MNFQDYKAKHRALCADIDRVLAQHGFKGTKTSANFESTTGDVRLTLHFHDAAGPDPSAELFKRYAEACGLRAEWLGARIPHTDFVVAGMAPRGSKTVLLTKGGKTYKMTPSALSARMMPHRYSRTS